MTIECEWASYKYGKTTANLEVFGMWIKQESEMLIGVQKAAPFQQTQKIKGSLNFHSVSDMRECLVCSGVRKLRTMHCFPRRTILKNGIVSKGYFCVEFASKNYMVKKCNLQNNCGINECFYRNRPLLHKPPPDQLPAKVKNNIIMETLNLHQNTADETFFKILPVKVSWKNKSIDTFAMLDDGCCLTLVHQSIANFLNLQGLCVLKGQQT